MTVQILVLLLGLALVVAGADALVDGASSIARRAGVSEFVIGLTIVGFGTSMPELVVSLSGALEGNGDVSVGNVVGSNIFNVLMILGLTAVISPLAVTRENFRRDIPLTLAFTLAFTLLWALKLRFGLSLEISRTEGAVFLVLFAIYIYFCFKCDKPDSAPDGASGGVAPCRGAAVSAALSLGGIAALCFGGRLFVDSAVGIARQLNVSDKFIAVTVLAGGTSVPELATCVVAAVKKRGQLALGNILGSNIFNILLILGCSALVRPIALSGMNAVDFLVFAGSVLLLWAAVLTCKGKKLSRAGGALMLLSFAAYFGYLFRSL